MWHPPVLVNAGHMQLAFEPTLGTRRLMGRSQPAQDVTQGGLYGRDLAIRIEEHDPIPALAMPVPALIETTPQVDVVGVDELDR